MTAQPSDILDALLELISAAAKKGIEEALSAWRDSDSTRASPLLVDKRLLAHALGISVATVDRLCRAGAIPFVHVGDARRFDLEAVRAALRPSDTPAPPPTKPASTPTTRARSSDTFGIRLRSRTTQNQR